MGWLVLGGFAVLLLLLWNERSRRDELIAELRTIVERFEAVERKVWAEEAAKLREKLAAEVLATPTDGSGRIGLRATADLELSFRKRATEIRRTDPANAAWAAPVYEDAANLIAAELDRSVQQAVDANASTRGSDASKT